MEDLKAQVGWTEAKWNRITQVVTEEAARSRIAASFLPVYGPLPISTQVVPRDYMHSGSYRVDDIDVTKIVEIYGEFQLRQSQVADESLSTALLLFRRAANVISRIEDWIIFNGQPQEDHLPENQIARALYTIRYGEPGSPGLWSGAGQRIEGIPNNGERLVPTIAKAVGMLEAQGYLGPFVCVLGDYAFEVAYTPDPHSLVLPKDRIEPLLGRPILRSSTLFNLAHEERGEPSRRPARRNEREGERPEAHRGEIPRGLVVSLAGEPIDLAVVVDAAPQFLSVDREGNLIFRVYERFALRLKEPKAIVALSFEPVLP